MTGRAGYQPRKTRGTRKTRCFRFSDAELADLAKVARDMERTPSDALRVLIRRAARAVHEHQFTTREEHAA